MDKTDHRVGAALVAIERNADKPKVVVAESRLAQSYLPPPPEADVAFSMARAAKGSDIDYAKQMEFGRKLATAVNKAWEKLEADQAEAKRVSDLKDTLIPAPGNVLIVADWAGIEARCNPWLSGDAEDVLQVFRDGSDIYVREAQGIFRVIQVSPEQRQVGKVAILACGYGGGVGAFAAMSKAYGVSLTESEAKRTVDAWRRANQWAVNYWQQLEIAYMKAMRHKGREFSAGRVTYMFDGIHLWYILPSGRVLCYPFARLEATPSKKKSYASDLVKGDRLDFDTGAAMMLDAARSGESPYKAYSQKTEFGVTYLKAAWKPTAEAKEWPRARLWKGLACENITQAVANDLLRHSLRQIDAVLHIHDEIVVECAKKNADAVAAQLEHIMCTPPAWATGLPLSVEVKIMKRYGK